MTMVRMTIRTGLVAAWPLLLLAGAPSVRAQQPGSESADGWYQPATRWQKATDLVDKQIQNAQGETVADVQDFIIDMASGRVTFATVKCDGKQCPVPFSAVHLPADAKKFTTTVTKEQLKARAYESDLVPNFGDRTWAADVYGHYHQTPYWERHAGASTPGTEEPEGSAGRPMTQGWIKAHDLIGKGVRNSHDEDLGKIEDLVVDPDSGRIIYGVLSFGGFLGMGEKLFAMPWSSITRLTGDHKYVVLSVEKDRLKNASGFDKDRWPNMADQQWATTIHSYYGQRPYWEREPQRQREDRDKP
jgi:sporulation protein YlmC with PRC-barrel domain